MIDVGRVPRLVREVSLPALMPAGEALTPDGRYLLVAAGSGVVVLGVAAMESGSAPAVVGVLSTGRGVAVGVVSSLDGRFVFVTLEVSDEVAVFDLGAALAGRFRGTELVGTVRPGRAVAGIAASPDGRWLYVTSELAVSHSRVLTGHGTLTVVDLARAEHDPARAVVATVPAGCGPVRVLVSADGRVVWVTARESNAVLAFSAARLLSDPQHALLAQVRVGQAPVALAFADGDRRLVVADSNRFGLRGATADLAIVDPRAALAGKQAVRGEIPTGGFPRDLAFQPTRNALLVTDYASNQLQAVNTATLP